MTFWCGLARFFQRVRESKNPMFEIVMRPTAHGVNRKIQQYSTAAPLPGHREQVTKTFGRMRREVDNVRATRTVLGLL